MFELLPMKEAKALDAKSRAKVAELQHAYAMHEVKQAGQAQLDAFHADRAREDAESEGCWSDIEHMCQRIFCWVPSFHSNRAGCG